MKFINKSNILKAAWMQRDRYKTIKYHFTGINNLAPAKWDSSFMIVSPQGKFDARSDLMWNLTRIYVGRICLVIRGLSCRRQNDIAPSFSQMEVYYLGVVISMDKAYLLQCCALSYRKQEHGTEVFPYQVKITFHKKLKITIKQIYKINNFLIVIFRQTRKVVKKATLFWTLLNCIDAHL